MSRYWLNQEQSTKYKEQREILHESPIFVRKEVSIAVSIELTKLYNPLTDSLRPFSIQFVLKFGRKRTLSTPNRYRVRRSSE